MRLQLDAIQATLARLFTDDNKAEDMELDENVEPVQTGDNQPWGPENVEDGQVEQPLQLAHPLEAGADPQAQEPEFNREGQGQGVEGMEPLDEAEHLILEPRVSPVVPPPGTVAPEWAAINSLGAWDSFLCRFLVLQEVPEQHKGAWAAA